MSDSSSKAFLELSGGFRGFSRTFLRGLDGLSEGFREILWVPGGPRKSEGEFQEDLMDY